MLNWLKRFWSWLARAHHMWACIAGLAGSLVFSWKLPIESESKLRAAGTILQLLGVMTVALDLSQKRKLFGQNSILNILYNWIRQIPPLRRSVVIRGMGGTVSAGGSASARGYVWSNPPADATLEERLRTLERNLERVREQAVHLDKRLDNEERSRATAISDERNQRARADNDIRLAFERTETSGLHLSVIGIIWLCIGIILGTLAAEICLLFSL